MCSVCVVILIQMKEFSFHFTPIHMEVRLQGQLHLFELLVITWLVDVSAKQMLEVKDLNLSILVDG